MQTKSNICGRYCWGIYVPDLRWGKCSPRSMSQIPALEYALRWLCPRSSLGHMFSEDYVPIPVWEYALWGLYPRSITGHMSYANYVLISHWGIYVLSFYYDPFCWTTDRACTKPKQTTEYDHIFFLYIYIDARCHWVRVDTRFHSDIGSFLV